MNNSTTFIGIDLAWRSDRNHTGAAALAQSFPIRYPYSQSRSMNSANDAGDMPPLVCR
jgi:hypothetical protein